MIKKLITVLTAIAVFGCSLPLFAYADENGIDTGLLDFETVTGAAGITAAFRDTGYLNPGDDVILNANNSSVESKIETVTWTDDADKDFGTSIAIRNKSGYPTLRVMSGGAAGTVTDNFVLSFSLKKEKTDSSFAFVMYIGGDKFPLAFANSGYVNLCGKETARYEADTWYDAELKFNPSKAYMRFSFKKHSDSVWNTYDAFFTKDLFESPVDTTGGFSRIEIGYISAVDEAAYMDNIRYYTVGAEDIVPSMSSLNDDFSELPSTYTNGTTPDDYAKQWRTGNFNSSHRLECTEVDGARALALCGNSGYGFIGKPMPELPEDTTSIIKFGLGVSTENATVYFIVNNTDTSLFSLSGGSLIVENDVKERFEGFEAGKIHSLQFVYNRKKQIARLILPSGDIVNLPKFNFSKELGSVDFQLITSTDAKLYLSDFRYDIAGDTFDVTNKYAKSGFETANLDDTIVFGYSQIISEDSGITCEIREKGAAEYTPCTAEIKLDKIEIKPEIMKPDTEYEIRVNGAKSIFEIYAPEESYSFKTADFDINAAAPKMNDGKISAFIYSAYSNAAPVSVIALTSDDKGNLLEAADFTVYADQREGKEYTVTPSFTLPYKSVKLFVWDNIINACAYSPSAEYGATAAAAPSAGEGSEPISEVRIDKSAGKLIISGYNNSDKYNTAVIEVLNDGVAWSGDGKALTNYDASKDGILDYLCCLTQIDNLGKNKPYTVSLNYNGDKIPKIMVRFGRDSAVYFDSEIIERVNAAKTAEELKEILLNDDYVKKTVGDKYSLRIKDETAENIFWNTFLEEKNKVLGTDKQFSSMYGIVGALEKNINLTVIKSADTADKMDAAVSVLKQDNELSGNSFDLYFGEGVFAGKSYLSDGSKKRLLEKTVQMRNSYENTAAFVKDLAQNTLLYSVCGNGSKYNVYDIIANSDLITKSNITKYTALKKVNQIEVCDKINTASVPFESIAALESAIRDYAGEYDGSSSGNKAPGGSGGGSGGSGGSGGLQSSSKTNNTPSNDSGKSDTYSDLDSVLWAKTAIESLSSRNIVSGTGGGKFSPSETVKREEFVKMLVGVINVNVSEKEVNFSDTDKNAWYWEYVKKAAAGGIVMGVSDTEFGIGREITREQMAAMIYRAVKSSGLDIPRKAAAEFSDYGAISDYAKEACGFMAETGIMNGKTGGVFDPSAAATRAEAAKVIYELLLRTEATK